MSFKFLGWQDAEISLSYLFQNHIKCWKFTFLSTQPYSYPLFSLLSMLLVHYHRIIEVGRYRQISSVPTPAQAGKPRAGCPKPDPGSFWRPPRREIWQPLLATYHYIYIFFFWCFISTLQAFWSKRKSHILTFHYTSA